MRIFCWHVFNTKCQWKPGFCMVKFRNGSWQILLWIKALCFCLRRFVFKVYSSPIWMHGGCHASPRLWTPKPLTNTIKSISAYDETIFWSFEPPKVFSNLHSEMITKKEHPVSVTEEQRTEQWKWNQQEGSKTELLNKLNRQRPFPWLMACVKRTGPWGTGPQLTVKSVQSWSTTKWE